MTWLVALGLALMVDPSPRQFDLECVGTQKTILAGEKPWRDRLRVDLQANIYCWRDCSVREEIYRVADGEIIFRNAGGTTSVNRVTGDFSSIERLGNDYLTIEGRCVRREFTPIAERLF